jgi:L,D-transpeptidase catalytic domain
VVFRPYWNVPPSIQRSEIVPTIQKDRDYVSKKGFEVVTGGKALRASGQQNNRYQHSRVNGSLNVGANMRAQLHSLRRLFPPQVRKGWLDWTLDLRNMLVHCGRRIELGQLVPCH